MNDMEFSEDVYDLIRDEERLQESAAEQAKERPPSETPHVSQEERTILSSVDTFAYEISKNRKNIATWNEHARSDPRERAWLMRQIADAERRIEYLEGRISELQDLRETTTNDY